MFSSNEHFSWLTDSGNSTGQWDIRIPQCNKDSFLRIAYNNNRIFNPKILLNCKEFKLLLELITLLITWYHSLSSHRHFKNYNFSTVFQSHFLSHCHSSYFVLCSILVLVFPWWLSSDSSVGHLFISQSGDCPVDRCAQGVLNVISTRYMSHLRVPKAN